MHGNRIEYVPPAISTMTALKVFRILPNPLIQPPLVLIKDVVLQHFSQDTEPDIHSELFICKLMKNYLSALDRKGLPCDSPAQIYLCSRCGCLGTPGSDGPCSILLWNDIEKIGIDQLCPILRDAANCPACSGSFNGPYKIGAKIYCGCSPIAREWICPVCRQRDSHA